MSIYEQICETRDRVFKSDKSALSRIEKVKILTQLMLLAFNNELHPDQLPQLFRIRNMETMCKEFIKNFLEYSLHLKVESIALVDSNYVRGNTFEVVLSDEC